MGGTPHHQQRLSLLSVLLLVAVGLLPPTMAAASPPDDLPAGGVGKVATVMTRNVYLGADLTPAIVAADLPGLTAATGHILREVTANDFPTRVAGLADEILEREPDLVGLQEVALWRTGPPTMVVFQTGPSATTVRYDYLQELLDHLNATRPTYEVVVAQDQFDLEAPADENGIANDGPASQGIPDAEINARLTMRDVILARVDRGVRTANADGDNFDTELPLTILGVPIPVVRGWVSTDVAIRGSGWFRFVNTHLEAFQPQIRALQAGELVDADGPATSDLPVVLVGDLNSDDDTVDGDDRLAYGVLLGAGMASRTTGADGSCCLASSLLAVGAGGSVDDFDHQVDHVMTRDPDLVTLEDTWVTGLEPVNGFWNSDHAGVTSALRVGR